MRVLRPSSIHSSNESSIPYVVIIMVIRCDNNKV